MTAQGQAALSARVETWLETRPSWLRASAQGTLATRKRPDDAGIDVLADHCLAEAVGPVPGFCCGRFPTSRALTRLAPDPSAGVLRPSHRRVGSQRQRKVGLCPAS